MAAPRARGRVDFLPWAIPAHIALSADGTELLSSNDGSLRTASASPAMLNAFARLSRKSASPAAVLAFAERYGVLGLCRTHGEPDCPARACREGPERPSGAEAITHWRGWSRYAAAILELAEAQRRNEPGARETWASIAEHDKTEEADREPRAGWRLDARGMRPEAEKGWETVAWLSGGRIAELPQPGSLAEARGRLAVLVDRWLRRGRVQPMMRAHVDGSCDIALGGSGLFGGIGMQLAASVAQGNVALCGWCGMPFIEDRPAGVRGGRASRYCEPRCRWAAAKRRQRDSAR